MSNFLATFPTIVKYHNFLQKIFFQFANKLRHAKDRNYGCCHRNSDSDAGALCLGRSRLLANSKWYRFSTRTSKFNILDNLLILFRQTSSRCIWIKLNYSTKAAHSLKATLKTSQKQNQFQNNAWILSCWAGRNTTLGTRDSSSHLISSAQSYLSLVFISQSL